jgi:SAM-dependent methyltransferase
MHAHRPPAAPTRPPAATPGRRRPRRANASAAPPSAPPPPPAAAAGAPAAAGQQQDKPRWTGDGLLSRAVNGAIANPLLFGAMRVLAKGAMRRSARERGVDWAAHADAVAARQREHLAPLARAFAARSGLGMGPYGDDGDGDEGGEEGDGGRGRRATTAAATATPPATTTPYPDYYLVPFHSYERGNLEWEAAREVEPASLAIAMRTFERDAPAKDDARATARFAERAMARMRGGITSAVREYVTERRGLPAPRRILDVGCSTGISTRWLAAEFEAALAREEERRGEGRGAAAAAAEGPKPLDALVGLDLSPYFLAVAEDEERRRWGDGEDEAPSSSSPSSPSPSPSSALLGLRAAPRTLTRPSYVHGLAERAPFPDASFDLVAFNFVAHECPGRAIDAFCAEARRLLAPGKGVVYFSDNDPASATIQNLPPAIFTLMKSTEPWSDEYYAFSLEDALRRAGFKDVVKVASDHRHRVVMGVAPAAGGEEEEAGEGAA